MTPLEAVRQLKPYTYESETLEDGYQAFCFECNQRVDQGHAPECQWNALPRIVATLEAAQVVVDRAFFRDDGAYMERRPGYTDALMALARVMKGEES